MAGPPQKFGSRSVPVNPPHFEGTLLLIRLAPRRSQSRRPAGTHSHPLFDFCNLHSATLALVAFSHDLPCLRAESLPNPRSFSALPNTALPQCLSKPVYRACALPNSVRTCQQLHLSQSPPINTALHTHYIRKPSAHYRSGFRLGLQLAQLSVPRPGPVQYPSRQPGISRLVSQSLVGSSCQVPTLVPFCTPSRPSATDIPDCGPLTRLRVPVSQNPAFQGCPSSHPHHPSPLIHPR